MTFNIIIRNKDNKIIYSNIVTGRKIKSDTRGDHQYYLIRKTKTNQDIQFIYRKESRYEGTHYGIATTFPNSELDKRVSWLSDKITVIPQ